MKLKQKVSGIYFGQPFTGKIVELTENIRYNHKNNCLLIKVELENGIQVYPGCVTRDYITMVLDANTLELNGNKVLKDD